MPTKHFKYGGSTAARTLGCPDWVNQISGTGGSKTSVFAERGTLQHDYMENILNGDMELAEIPDDEDRERCQWALDAWDDLCKTYGVADYVTEQEFSMGDEIGGTADVVAWTADRTLIVDWKFGQGIQVEAVGSAQGMFYAMCAAYEGQVKGALTIAIIQPITSRAGHNTLSVWDVPADVFELFKRSFSTAIANAQNTLNAGSHCQYCPAAPTCTEKSGQAHAALLMSTDTADTLGENMTLAMELQKWINEVKTKTHEQLELGGPVKGWKLVPKRASRNWEDEDEVLKVLKKNRKLKAAELMVTKMASVAQMEKMFKKKGLDFDTVGAYISKTSTGTTVATEDDPRESVHSADTLRVMLNSMD
jgi:hypothetical protein